MVPLNTIFWGMVLLFGLIGALRGWAKEIMVASSVLLAMFVQQVFAQFVLGPGNPYLPMLFAASSEVAEPLVYTETQYFAVTGLLLLLVFCGYAGPALVSRFTAKIVREKLQDVLLGFFLGLLNGYLIIGMLWFYLHRSGYILGGVVQPLEGSPAWAIANQYLLPNLISPGMLYVGVAIAFVFVIIVFI
jgi:hypothetical protein